MKNKLQDSCQEVAKLWKIMPGILVIKQNKSKKCWRSCQQCQKVANPMKWSW